MKQKKQLIIKLKRNTYATPNYWYDTNYSTAFTANDIEIFERNDSVTFLQNGDDALLKNQVFQPPFTIDSCYRGCSCAGFYVLISLSNGEDFRASVKLDTFTSLLKDHVNNNQITYPMTFIKRGTVFLFEKAEETP